MADGANVIRFTGKHIRPEILSDEMAKRQEQGKQFYIAEITDRYCEQAVEGFSSFGIDIYDPMYEKCFAYLQMVAAGIFCLSAGMPHDINAIIEKGKPVLDEAGNRVGYRWEFPKRKVDVEVANTQVEGISSK